MVRYVEVRLWRESVGRVASVVKQRQRLLQVTHVVVEHHQQT